MWNLVGEVVISWDRHNYIYFFVFSLLFREIEAHFKPVLLLRSA